MHAGPVPEIPARLEVLADGRGRLQVTLSVAARDQLRYAQALLSHCLAPGDVGALLERALEALVEQQEKRRFGAATRTKPCKAPSRTSRAGGGDMPRPRAFETAAGSRLHAQRGDRGGLRAMPGCCCRELLARPDEHSPRLRSRPATPGRRRAVRCPAFGAAAGALVRALRADPLDA